MRGETASLADASVATSCSGQDTHSTIRTSVGSSPQDEDCRINSIVMVLWPQPRKRSPRIKVLPFSKTINAYMWNAEAHAQRRQRNSGKISTQIDEAKQHQPST
jgi:hypothetical protein